jgi:HK97 family phage prohead protease
MIENRILNIDKTDEELVTRSVKTEDGRTEIIGYAAVFNHRSKPITEKINGQLVTYFETIDKRAFDGAEMTDTIYCIDHDPSKLIARASAGNLELKVTEKGLMFRAVLPDTTIAKDLAENIAVGNYYENSFAFRVSSDKFSKDAEGNLYRNITGFKRVADVSTVINGSYSDTAVVSRSIDANFEVIVEVTPAQPEVNEVEMVDDEFNIKYKRTL